MAFTYINTSDQLKECIIHLSKKNELAIDLEFDKNRFRYGFNLCLMQVFSGEECFLIDPLSKELDITLVFPILENESIQKIAFSFSEDIRLLHHIGCIPKGIYDLSIVSSLLDFPPTSLTNLLDTILGITVGKSSQQSNWFNRPLSEDQLEYAASDVLHLLKLKEALNKQASERGIEDWIKQENELFESANYEGEEHNNFLKDKDKGDLTQFEWHLFTRLMEFRESVAKRLNKPTHHLIDKKYLLEVARYPKQVKDWQNLRSTHKKLKNKTVENEVFELLASAIDEAEKLKISRTKKASNSFTKEEFQAFKQIQKEIENAKQKVFKPIQREMEKDMGKHAQTFILNNRLIKELVNRDTSKYLLYKKKLIEDYAKKLNLLESKYIPD